MRVAALLTLVAALALAGTAAAYRMDTTYGSQSFVGVETDGPPSTETTPTDTTPTTTAPTTTTPDVCPSTAVSQDPNPACPPEPYAADDQGNPVLCNYDSGVPANPCPHADSTHFVVLCTGADADGATDTIYYIVRDGTTPGVDDPETLCPNGHAVLDP